MGNKSDWKGFEQLIADALGGKRRNFSEFASARSKGGGSTVTDVYWGKTASREFPCLKRLKVECKKRRSVNVYDEFLLATMKYAKDEDSIVILACKRPVPRDWEGKTREKLKQKMRKLGMHKAERKKYLRRSVFTQPLVVVNLDFFKQLFELWKVSHIKERSK